MAVPSYTTDLSSGVISTCESNTNFTNIGTGADADETDYYIQGTHCVSKPFNITTGGIYFNFGSGITFTSGQCYFAWYYFAAPNALLAETAGGMQALIGSSGADYRRWDVFGSDTYTYGGWRCVPIDPINVTADDTTGTPSGTRQYFGVYTNTSVGIGKGNPLGLDVMRYGRGEARVADGSLADGRATFSGLATENDNTSNRWGLFQAIDGGYLWQGLLILGYSTAVDFLDSNKNILIANTKKVLSTFNAIEIRQSGSVVNWTGIQISSLVTEANSRGSFTVVDNANVDFDGCTFNDMGTFTFQANSTILTTTFRRCDLVTQASAVFTSCRFSSTHDSTKALLCNNPANITSCAFVSSGTKHGIEFNTPGTYTWSGNTFSAYASSDGSTGNEAVYNNCTPYNTGQTYASSNQDSTLSLRSDAGGTSAAGESFAAGATKVLSAARFYLKKTGSPSGNATAKIYAVTGSAGSYTPTGAALATSETYGVSNLTGSYQMIEFKFKDPNCISLTSGTNYFVILDVSATTSSSGNTIDIGYDNTPAFATGNGATFAVGGSWTAQSYDVIFDCYTDGAVILNLSGGGTTPTIRNALGCSTSVVASVNISVYIVNTSNSPINDAQVAIYRTSDDLEIMNKDTGYDAAGDGYATTTYNKSTPADIYVRVRKSSAAATKYIPVSSSGTIASSTGYSVTFILSVDPNA